MSTEKLVGIASRMYEARRTYRALRGKAWRSDLAPFMEQIQIWARRGRCDEIKAAVEIIRSLPDMSALEKLTVIAAAVEVVEPTPVLA